MYDAAIVGLGGMGSAAAAWAARRGLKTVAIEQYEPIHSLGASHGKARLIRMAYFEGADYVPLLRRSYDLWSELERLAGVRLFDRCGAIYTGAPQTPLIAGTLASAQECGLDVRRYEPDELRARFSFLRPLENEIGVFESAGGVVFPEVTLAATIELAREAGADLRFEERVVQWNERDGGVRLTLASGDVLEAKRLALCTGFWIGELAKELGAHIALERNVQAWFSPADRRGIPHAMPAFALERAGRFFYGFPDYGEGVKAGFHCSGVYAENPAAVDRTVTGEDVAEVHAWMESFVPPLAGLMQHATACTYDVTPDRHFILGGYPGTQRTFVAGGFSGHGFKFAPVVGEIVAEYLEHGATAQPVEMFSPLRFAR